MLVIVVVLYTVLSGVLVLAGIVLVGVKVVEVVAGPPFTGPSPSVIPFSVMSIVCASMKPDDHASGPLQRNTRVQGDDVARNIGVIRSPVERSGSRRRGVIWRRIADRKGRWVVRGKDVRQQCLPVRPGAKPERFWEWFPFRRCSARSALPRSVSSAQ